MAYTEGIHSGAIVEDRRNHPRARVLRRAKIVFNRGYGVLDCVLLDLSAHGARVKLDLLDSMLTVPEAGSIARPSEQSSHPKKARNAARKSSE